MNTHNYSEVAQINENQKARQAEKKLLLIEETAKRILTIANSNLDDDTKVEEFKTTLSMVLDEKEKQDKTL